MPRYRVRAYNQGSRSARALADALGGRVLLNQGSRFVPRRDDVIINWGSVQPLPVPRALGVRAVALYNPPEEVQRASNKLHFFNLMQEQGLGDIIPQFWTRREDIPNEAFDNNGIVVCRTELAGHSGAGIVLARNVRDLVRCSLYTQYVKKQEEYRIHVGQRGGQSIIISSQRKARRHGVEDAEINWQIRNHHNGFVFVRHDINPPRAVLDSAQQALAATGLDFGAVDVIWNERQQRAYVLEINTAPGLEGQTVTDYATFFQV